jgi:hypothetical protein
MHDRLTLVLLDVFLLCACLQVRDRFEFPLEIDMFSYTADGLAAADQQQKAAEQQQEEQQLQKQGSEASQQQQDGAGTSSSGGEGGQLPRQLSDSAQQALAGKSAAAGGGSSGSAYMYDLMGVVVHSGSAFTGHYYSYIKERRPSAAGCSSSSKGAAGGRWYLFDDKSVTEWDVKDLEPECFGGKASQDFDSRSSRPARNEYERAHSAYMLFYERRQQQQPDAAPGASTAASAGANEQQQQQQGVGADDADVPMAPASPSSRAAADEAAAAAAGEASAAAVPGPDGIPYGMPLRLYKSVMEQNISAMWQQHVLDKDYFRFVRQLVDSRGDLGQLSTRKSRRRDGSVSTPAAAVLGAAAGTAAAAAGGGSGSSSRIPSSMSCDVQAGGTAAAAKQQQKQPQVVVDAGDSTAAAAAGSAASPCPMAISPAPGAPLASAPSAAAGSAAPAPAINSPAAAAATSNGHNGLILTPPTGDMQASPGPSSRRGEEADAVAQALLRLGVLFQFQVYLRASDGLRSEGNVWMEALMSLMGSGPSSSTCMQVRGWGFYSCSGADTCDLTAGTPQLAVLGLLRMLVLPI